MLACRLVAMIVVLLATAESASAAIVLFDVRTIVAYRHGGSVDPRLASLAQDLRALKLSGFELKDQTTVGLEIGRVGRVHILNEAWLSITALGLSGDKARVELAVSKPEFKTTASIALGATLAIGGPPYNDGVLILAVTPRAAR